MEARGEGPKLSLAEAEAFLRDHSSGVSPPAGAIAREDSAEAV